MSLDLVARQLSARQHALIAIVQLRDLGATDAEIRWLRHRDRWEALSRRVLRLAGSPATPAQRAMAAVLDASPGAMLSHSSAAAWWNIPGFDLEPLHVTRPRGMSRRASSLARVHEVVTILPHHVKVFEEVPVSAPARMICELAAMGIHPLRLARACDTAWSAPLFNGPTMHRVANELAASGRNGTTLVRDLLATRPVDYLPPASGLERRVIAILAAAGIPGMSRQVHAGGDEWVGRIDLRDREYLLLVEVNSERYHKALTDTAADEIRYARLDAAGWEVCVVWEQDAWYRPRKVVSDVRQAR